MHVRSRPRLRQPWCRRSPTAGQLASPCRRGHAQARQRPPTEATMRHEVMPVSSCSSRSAARSGTSRGSMPPCGAQRGVGSSEGDDKELVLTPAGSRACREDPSPRMWQQAEATPGCVAPSSEGKSVLGRDRPLEAAQLGAWGFGPPASWPHCPPAASASSVRCHPSACSAPSRTMADTRVTSRTDLSTHQDRA